MLACFPSQLSMDFLFADEPKIRPPFCREVCTTRQDDILSSQLCAVQNKNGRRERLCLRHHIPIKRELAQCLELHTTDGVKAILRLIAPDETQTYIRPWALVDIEHDRQAMLDAMYHRVL